MSDDKVNDLQKAELLLHFAMEKNAERGSLGLKKSEGFFNFHAYSVHFAGHGRIGFCNPDADEGNFRELQSDALQNTSCGVFHKF